MRSFLQVWILLLILVTVSWTAMAGQPDFRGKRPYIPGQIIVKFKKAEGKPGLTRKAESALALKGISEVRQVYTVNRKTDWQAYQSVGLDRVISGRVSMTVDVEELALQLKADPTVEYASPNYLVKADSVVPNDPQYLQEQHLPQVGASQAWEVSTGDTSIIIAVLDTGVDWDHPDLAGNIWRNADEIPGNGIDDDGNLLVDDFMGWDFVDNVGSVWDGEDGSVQDNNPMDFDGHGTHVAGIASAVTNNGTGIASLAWKCRIMPIRIGYHSADGNGYGTYEAMGQGFMYAADNGAHVANLSYGTGEPILDAARYAYLRGVVVCNSAGNSNTDFASILGAQPFALSIASVAADDKKASYSSYNSSVDISAPGGDFSGAGGGFLSTFVNPSSFFGGALYGRFQGTSMASPYVASLAGLLKSVHPSWTPADVMFQILATADSIDDINPFYRGKLGAGRINAYRAVTETPPPASPRIAFRNITITDAGSGNNNGRPDPGETVKILVQIENTWGDLTGGVMTFSTTSPAVNVTSGVWNVGTLHGIRDLDNMSVSNTTSPFTVSIHPSAVPMVISCMLTLTGDNGVHIERALDLSISPSVLFVDDHGGSGDAIEAPIEPYFSKAFHASNIAYTYWDHTSQGTPDASILAKYSLVVWGCEWAFPSLDQSDRNALASYIRGGGRLFLSGQDIGWDLNATPSSGSNEYSRSGGTSQTWFEEYLGAQFVADDGNGGELTTRITGVAGDPIGDGISFEASQPGRAAALQYPDVIQPLSDGIDIFRYEGSSNAGAVRNVYFGRVVYFAFGGLESIMNDSIRNLAFDRVVSWLYQRRLTFTELPDLEDSTASVTVDAHVEAPLDTLESVELYWDTDGAFPYNPVPMTDLGSGNYRGVIPAQNRTTAVDYFVLVKTSAGAMPVSFRTFHVGMDQIPPVVSIIARPANSIRRSGPFAVKVIAKDNIGIDTNEVFVVFSVDGGPPDSSQLHPTGLPSEFGGSFMLPVPATSGSVVSYHVRTNDVSLARNSGRAPFQGDEQFSIGIELLDDFETAQPKWDFGLSWARVADRQKSGKYSITDSPGVNMPSNTTNTLTLTVPLDFNGYSKSMLTFWHLNGLHSRDTVYVEESVDGLLWTSKLLIMRNQPWTQDSVLLSPGAQAESLRIRFRLLTGSHPSSWDGIYLDDIEIKTEAFIAGIRNDASAELPPSFVLHRNYPNPFNPSTTIRFDLPAVSVVSLTVYNLLGQEVAQLIQNRSLVAGTYSVDFDASGLSSGIYFARLSDGKSVGVQRMLLLR